MSQMGDAIQAIDKLIVATDKTKTLVKEVDTEDDDFEITDIEVKENDNEVEIELTPEVIAEAIQKAMTDVPKLNLNAATIAKEAIAKMKGKAVL